MKAIFCASRAISRRYRRELEGLGIQVTEQRPTTWRMGESKTIGQCDAAVVDLDALSAHERHAMIADLQRQDTCVVGLVGGVRDGTWQHGLQEDLDGLVSADSAPIDLACALWSAHRQFELRRVLTQRMDELQVTLQRRKRIERAKALIAATLGMPEAEALKHLRREARKRRRTMDDIARVVIEASSILFDSNDPIVAAEGGAVNNMVLTTSH